MLNSILVNFNYSLIITKFIGIVPIVVQLILIIVGIKFFQEKHKALVVVLIAVSSILLIGNIFFSFTGMLNERVIDEFEGKVYFGQVENGRANGWGRLFDEERNILYIGEFKDNQYEGHGKLYDISEETVYLKYEGDFVDAQYDGKGDEYIYNQGEHLLVYTGEYKYGERNGQGTYHQYGEENIEIENYQGSWAYGKYFGYGIQTVYDMEKETEKKYVGTFVWSKKEGWGSFYRNDEIVYYGDWKNNLFDGKGTQIYENSNGDYRKYKGEFSEGKVDGQGIIYDIENNVIYEGKFVNGEYADEED